MHNAVTIIRNFKRVYASAIVFVEIVRLSWNGKDGYLTDESLIMNSMEQVIPT